MNVERRLGVVERRLGVGRGPLANFSDVDLLDAIQVVCERLAEIGDTGALAALAAHDAEEAELAEAGRSCGVAIQPGVRWPRQRARASRWKQHYPGQGPRRARDTQELIRKIEAALTAMRRAS